MSVDPNIEQEKGKNHNKSPKDDQQDEPPQKSPGEQDVEKGAAVPSAEPTKGSQEQNQTQLMFSEASIRAAFVRKVFSVVTWMFACVAAFSSLPIFIPEVRRFCQVYWGFYILSLVVFIVFYIILICCSSCRRAFPTNVIMLSIFTISASVMTMFITAQYDVISVFVALLITTICSASIVVFAMFTDKDLTTCFGVAFILGICLLLFGIFAFIFVIIFHWYFLYLVYAILGALLSMFYLAIDIQWIMGGRSHEISPEEWVFASMTLFVDFLNIFLFILSIVGYRG